MIDPHTFLIGYLIIGVLFSAGVLMYDYRNGTTGELVAYFIAVFLWWLFIGLFIIERMTHVKSE